MRQEIRVLIVDDSLVSRDLLKHIIESEPGARVVGMVENGEAALSWLEHQICDVITMDLHMPMQNGFEVTKQIMKTKPTPTVIISSGFTHTDEIMAFRAIEAGALAILEKPAGFRDNFYHQKAKEIIETIKMIADIKVVRRTSYKAPRHIGEGLEPEHKKQYQAVAIGASLGGPIAIAEILSELDHNFCVPIFIVQHIAIGFTEGFVKWLQDKSKLKIVSASAGEIAKPGHVYVGIDRHQMKVNRGGIISLEDNDKTQPSINVLFKSMVTAYGANAIGVLLTGMGKDGAEGLFAMKQKGAYTIAQDEESSLVFGMPKEAVNLGAATKVLPLVAIAPALNFLLMGFHMQKGELL